MREISLWRAVLGVEKITIIEDIGIVPVMIATSRLYGHCWDGQLESDGVFLAQSLHKEH